MKDNSIFVPPRSIKIDDYSYTYKDKLTNDFYSYRSKHRQQCKITIKIEKKELKLSKIIKQILFILLQVQKKIIYVT